MSNTIRQQYFYEHSAERVWEYLTKPELLELWLMPNDFQPIPGYSFQFRYKPIPAFQIDGIMHCTVLEVVPFKKLSYTWKAGPGDGTFNLDTRVEWTLISRKDGTELHLEHSGFKEKENFDIFQGMTDGWLKNMQKIATHINSAINDAANS